MTLYRLLLRIFPASFRRRFGDDMAETFADRQRRAGSVRTRARLWVRTINDVVVHGVAERRLERHRRDSHRWRNFMSSLNQDLRFAWRALRQRPALALIALVTLSLGIGANTAIFSVVHAVLIRDLPYADADRIVNIYESFRQNRNRGVANPFNYDRWERQAKSFEHLAASRTMQATLIGIGDPIRVWTESVTGAYFDVFGVAPELGRTLTSHDADRNAPHVVLSHRFWTTTLNGDPGVLGRPLTLDNETFTVVGVMPAAFRPRANTLLWRPLELNATTRSNMRAWFLGVVARLAPGVSAEQAQTELDAISAQLAREFPAQRADRGAWLISLQDDLAVRSADTLRMLQGIVVLVLLIACANVANLLLAWTSSRRRELSIRLSLGASRTRVIRQLVTESVVLSIAGGTLGVAFAAWGVQALVAAAPPNTLPAGVAIGVDVPVLAFTLTIAVLTGIAAGLAPALLYSSPRLADAIKDNSAASTGTGHAAQRWLRSALVAAEVAISLVLITASALLVRSFLHVTSEERGFRPDGLLTATVSLPASRYADASAQRSFWNGLLERVNAMPGVTAAGASTALPFSNWEWQSWFEVQGRASAPDDGVSIRTITPGYVDALRIPVRAGRAFTADDVAGGLPVAMVNESFARAYLGGGNPVGRLVRTERPQPNSRATTQLVNAASAQPTTPQWLTIVGVIGDTRHVRLEETPKPELYRPLAQAQAPMLVLALRTTGDPHALAKVLQAEVKAIDPLLPIEGVRSMEEAIDRTTAQRRFQMSLVVLFAIVAGALAIIGTYGVMTYMATLRRREVGIRIALGASATGVKRLLVRQGLRPVVAGVVLGAIASTWAGALLRDQLYGIDARDPGTIAGAAIAFVIVGAAACWVPARRSSSVDPIRVLRTE